MAAPDGYRRRIVDAHLRDLFAELPALMITGPRSAGKTTTAARLVRSVVRLDRASEATAFEADPDAALAVTDEPVLLDEWQEVPGVLGAVKRAVDGDGGAGRFILTGSVRADLEEATWPGTGRIVRVPMHGMTIGELEDRVDDACFLDRLAAGGPLSLPERRPDLSAYVEMAMRSGFPEPAIRLSPVARTAWLDSYIDQVVTRDAPTLGSVRDPARLRRYFETYALNTAGITSDSTLYEAAGVNRRTADGYERLLTNMFLVEAVPAWTSNRLHRLTARSKRYLSDAAMIASLIRVDERAILRDGDLLGRVLDTFVASQLRAELAVAATRPRVYHLREEHGRHEVDLLAELGGGAVIAFEVKASASPTTSDGRHLAWLRDRLGDRFARGAVLHTGTRAYELGDRLLALPICAMWA